MKNINVQLRRASLNLFLIFALIIFILSSPVASNAQDTPINKGVSWLLLNQNLDGSWSDSARQFSDTYIALESLLLLKINNIQVSAAINWVSSLYPDNVDDLSNKVLLLSMAGRDTSLEIATLLTIKNIDNGWRVDQDFPCSDVLDTALALRALKVVNYPDQDIISSALFYLTNNQNADGGWGLKAGMDSEVYYTALVLNTLSQFKSTYNLQTPINNAVTYLLAHQNPDGSFGEGTVYETALSFIALIASGAVGANNAQAMQIAINYLTSTQLPNGSWDDDPYSTALALRALAHVKPNLSIDTADIAFSNPTPTRGEMVTVTAAIHNSGPAQADNILSNSVIENNRKKVLDRELYFLIYITLYVI